LKLTTLLSIVFLIAAPALADPNLVQDGKPDQLPDKHLAPPIADSGAMVYTLSTGSKALSGWTVISNDPVRFYDWSGDPAVKGPYNPSHIPSFGGQMTREHPFLIDLHGAGAIEQEIPTVPGRTYRLNFGMGSQNHSTVVVNLGDDPANTASFTVQPNARARNFTATFTASRA
jgi:hypothetical protein